MKQCAIDCGHDRRMRALHRNRPLGDDMRVYAGGRINGCTDDEANGWRNKLRALLPNGWIVDPMVRDYWGREDECFREIVELDKDDIESCNVVLFYCWQPSWGTAMEIYHSWLAEKTVVVVVPEGQRISPWLLYHSNVIVTTLEAAADYIEGITG